MQVCQYQVTIMWRSCDNHVTLGPHLLAVYMYLGCLAVHFVYSLFPDAYPHQVVLGHTNKASSRKLLQEDRKFSKSTIHSGKFSWGSIFTDGQSFDYHFAIVYVQLSLFRRFNFWQLDGRPWKPQKLDPSKISHYIMVYTESILLYTPNRDLLRG